MEAIDDDFGELYPDVEVQATSAINGISDFARLYIEPEKDDGNVAKDKDVKLKEDFVPDEKKVHSACGEDSTHSGSEGLELNSGKEVNDYIESDSEDDLNIVLNDEDCQDFPVGVGGNRGVVTGVGYDEDDDGDFVAEGGNLGKNGNFGDQLTGGSELVTCNGHSGQSKNGVKRGYGSQFFLHKYIRTRRSTFVNNIKANKSVGMAYYSSPLIKGGWNGNACNQNQVSSSCHVARVCAAANPLVVQRGYGSFLPRYWSIFDVNIDTLEEKPWRIPGVDITNYFNFGFNENTWKEYCASLKKLWLASIETGIPVNEASKLNQEAMREQVDQVVSGSFLSPLSECEVPRGRAIQVEDRMGERQPSMDVRHPRSRDSDVIQIKVLESSDDCSDSGNSNVHEASEGGEFNAGNNRNILSSGSEHDDEVSGDHLEDEKKSNDSSVLKRHGSSPGVDKVENQNQMVQPSEDAAEALKEKTTAEEGICIDTCSADPCSIESELSFGDHDLSLTSYSDSDSEATKNSVHVNHEKSQSPLRRQSVNSVTGLKESTLSYHENSKSNSFNKKLVRKDYYSRHKGPVRQERRHQSARRQLNKHVEIDNVYTIPMSGATDLSLLDHEFVDYDSKKERHQDFGILKRRDVSCYRETERSCHYGSEKVVDELVHTVYTKYPDGEGQGSFGENRNRFVRKNWDEREYFSEQRSPLADDEDSERDWYHADRGHPADDTNPLSYWESRQFFSEHSSFPAKERDTRRRIYDKPQFRDRNSHIDDWFDEFENEFTNRSYGMPTSFTEREIEFLDYKHEDPFPRIDKELERSARRGRHHDRLPLDLDGLWSGKTEDECQEYTRYRALNLQPYRQCYTMSQRNHVHDTGVNNKFGGCRRHKYARKDRTNDWYCGYNDAAEDEDCIIHPVKECELERRRYCSPSEVLHWTEDEFAFGQQDELHDEETLFSYEKTSRYERTHARYGSLLGKMQIDDIQLQQHQLNIPKVGSDKRSSKIIWRGKRGQAVLKCRNSVNLVNGEEKSYGRSFRARNLVCNDRLENLDQGIAKKRTAIVGFHESHKRAIKSDISKSGSDHNKRKCLKNTPDKEQKEGLDIEEGQMVTEEPYVEASVSRRVVSKGSSLNDSVKKRMLQKENNSDRDKNVGGYDSQRILETLAKMEKRRERFKEPIATKKEAEQNLKLNVEQSLKLKVEQSLKLEDDLVVDTDKMKQHRPARKRRWSGS